MTLNMAIIQQYAFNLAGAIIVLLIGWPVANYFGRLIQKHWIISLLTSPLTLS